jgi:hypothetical protein
MSTQMKLWVAMLVLGPIAGFLVGRQTAPAADTSVLREFERQRALLEKLVAQAPTPPPEVQRAVAASPASAEDLARLRSELTQVLREELAQRASPPEATPPPIARAEPSPRNLEAHQQGHQLIDAATRARRWTDEDAQAFRLVLGDMTEAQREDVLRRLVTTINGRTLDIQTRGAPF